MFREQDEALMRSFKMKSLDGDDGTYQSPEIIFRAPSPGPERPTSPNGRGAMCPGLTDRRQFLECRHFDSGQ
jgi:hypothetical protein